MSYQIASMLDYAADRIEGYKWGRGGGGLCVGIAIEVARYKLGTSVALVPSIYAALGRVVRPDWPNLTFRDIVDWNDAPGRTQQQVLDALRKAAKNERIAADAVT